MDPIPAVRFIGSLGGKTAARQGSNRVLLERDRERTSSRQMQVFRLSRQHIGEHAEVDGLAGIGSPDRRDHLRMHFLSSRLMCQRHRRLAVAAQFGVMIVASLADVAGDLHGILGKLVRVEADGRFAHDRTLSGAGSNEGVSAASDGSQPTGSTSHTPTAQRNPMLCFRASGSSPDWN